MKKRLYILGKFEYNKKAVLRDAGTQGPVAQLGARSVRIREVEGSNPFRSTR